MECKRQVRLQFPEAVWLISRHWNWGILSIKTARPPAVKEQTVKVSQFLRACKVQTVILWISAIGNFNIIRSQRACKEQTTIQWISAIGNLNRYVDIMGCCPCVRWGELCVCVTVCPYSELSLVLASAAAGHSQCGPRNIIMFSVILNRKYLYHDDSVQKWFLSFP